MRYINWRVNLLKHKCRHLCKFSRGKNLRTRAGCLRGQIKSTFTWRDSIIGQYWRLIIAQSGFKSRSFYHRALRDTFLLGFNQVVSYMFVGIARQAFVPLMLVVKVRTQSRLGCPVKEHIWTTPFSHLELMSMIDVSKSKSEDTPAG